MEHLWSPWRMHYVLHERGGAGECFLCRAWTRPGEDEDHLVLARGRTAMVIMNRFPYNCGHVMVVPGRHVPDCAGLAAAESAEIWRLLVASQKALGALIHPEGFNVGLNQGKASGAGLAEHLHFHVVPRWDGDHNFMTVCADVRVVPQALADTYRRLKPLFVPAESGKEGGADLDAENGA